jgi:hypothetical protein
VYLDRQQLPTLLSSAIAGSTLGTVQGIASILSHQPMNGSLQPPNPLLSSTSNCQACTCSNLLLCCVQFSHSTVSSYHQTMAKSQHRLL